ncbi:MAG TPA: aquaporin [Steroidobacteraceae bacterium]|nr:aquaporin [Steroidobacteraceae bacterium]
MWRKVVAEALGALLLAACVIGSGIMAERLAAGNGAIALLANTLATVAGLATLITLFGPISGAHFNPIISAVAWRTAQIDARTATLFMLAQVAGCCAGAALANVMFELPMVYPSSHVRTGAAQWLSESVATAGLVFVAFRCATCNEAAWRVSLWIGAAYWFTASTSFANPAITIGRSLSDTFAGIRPVDVPGFIAAQIAGALVGAALLRVFAKREATA